MKQFISGRAGVTDINGELRHCSGECITVEAVRSWVAASVKNVLQLEKHTGPGSHGGLLFWWDSLPVSIKARICCFADLEAPRWNRKCWEHQVMTLSQWHCQRCFHNHDLSG